MSSMVHRYCGALCGLLRATQNERGLDVGERIVHLQALGGWRGGLQNFAHCGVPVHHRSQVTVDSEGLPHGTRLCVRCKRRNMDSKTSRLNVLEQMAKKAIETGTGNVPASEILAIINGG